jgi:hypothetical protein
MAGDGLQACRSAVFGLGTNMADKGVSHVFAGSVS